MEGYLQEVGEMMERFGLQKFFYLPDSLGVMKYLSEEPHNFTLEDVLKEHEDFLFEPSVVSDPNTSDETPQFIINCFKCYDLYE